jgi:hypothetical protein
MDVEELGKITLGRAKRASKNIERIGYALDHYFSEIDEDGDFSSIDVRMKLESDDNRPPELRRINEALGIMSYHSLLETEDGSVDIASSSNSNSFSFKNYSEKDHWFFRGAIDLTIHQIQTKYNSPTPHSEFEEFKYLKI